MIARMDTLSELSVVWMLVAFTRPTISCSCAPINTDPALLRDALIQVSGSICSRVKDVMLKQLFVLSASLAVLKFSCHTTLLLERPWCKDARPLKQVMIARVDMFDC